MVSQPVQHRFEVGRVPVVHRIRSVFHADAEVVERRGQPVFHGPDQRRDLRLNRAEEVGEIVRPIHGTAAAFGVHKRARNLGTDIPAGSFDPVQGADVGVFDVSCRPTETVGEPGGEGLPDLVDGDPTGLGRHLPDLSPGLAHLVTNNASSINTVLTQTPELFTRQPALSLHLCQRVDNGRDVLVGATDSGDSVLYTVQDRYD
jgi:hypothetical protein